MGRRKQDRPIKPCILFAWRAGDDDNPRLAQGRIWEGNPGPDASQMPAHNQRAIDGKKNNVLKDYDEVGITQLRGGLFSQNGYKLWCLGHNCSLLV